MTIRCSSPLTAGDRDARFLSGIESRKCSRNHTITFVSNFPQFTLLSFSVSHLSPWDTKALLSSPGLSSFRARQPRHIAPPSKPSSTTSQSHPRNLSNTSHTPSPASQCERKRRGLRASVDLPGNKDLENCVTKAVGHRADCCHCSPLPLKISSASSYTSSCSLNHPRPTLNAHRL